MGAETSSGGRSPSLDAMSKVSRRVRRAFLRKSKERSALAQLFGVIRHCERADCPFAYYNRGRWHETQDYQKWPLDPPLADSGTAKARGIASEVFEFAQASDCQVHVIISSPYFRCIQTAVEIFIELRSRQECSSPTILVDRSLGEVYGPAVMGSTEPIEPTRPLEETLAYVWGRGIHDHVPIIGNWPAWPEDLGAGRRRFATRFLRYLQRSVTTSRNFLLVTHADCIGAALSIMPSQKDRFIEKVGYGAMFLATRHHSPREITCRLSVDGADSRLSSFIPGTQSSQPAAGRGSHAHLDVTPEAKIDIPFTHSQSGPDPASTEQRGSTRTIRSARVGFPLRALRRCSAFETQVPVGSEPTLVENGQAELVAPSCLLKLPRPSDHWVVRISNVTMRNPPDDSLRAVRSIRKAAKHIGKLIGTLPQRPIDAAEIELNAVRIPTIYTNRSVPTSVAGASAFDNCSEIRDQTNTNTAVSVDAKLSDFAHRAYKASSRSGVIASACHRRQWEANSLCAGFSSSKSPSRWLPACVEGPEPDSPQSPEHPSSIKSRSLLLPSVALPRYAAA